MRSVTKEEREKLERKLRRRAKVIKKKMLADLQARGLVPKDEKETDVGDGLESGETGGWTSGGAESRTGRGGRKSQAAGGRQGFGTVFVQMVEDYVALWITREKLEADIAERGVTVMDEKRGLPVENCSVSARVRVSKQMTTIVQSLGYKDHAVKARRPEVEDDDL